MRIIRQFLEPIQREFLIRLSQDVGRIWTPGRQTMGYEHTPIDETCLSSLVQRSLGAITPEEIVGHDVYLIRYGDGAFIPPHTDPSIADGTRHGRLNALLIVPTSGGIFVHGAFSPQPLNLDDAVVFRPDVEEHSLTPVVGKRLIWSVGCNYRVRVRGLKS